MLDNLLLLIVGATYRAQQCAQRDYHQRNICSLQFALSVRWRQGVLSMTRAPTISSILAAMRRHERRCLG